MSGLAQVRVPKRKVKANSEPVKLLQPAFPSGYRLTCCTAGLNIGKDIFTDRLEIIAKLNNRHATWPGITGNRDRCR